jgi:hypothetical protein
MNAHRQTWTRRPPLIALLLFGAIAIAQTQDAPIINFKLPLFNDDGYRTGYLRGAQGIYSNNSDIRITDMELSQYSGDAQDAVIGSMESPEALFRYDKTGRSHASGPGSIMIENDTFRLTGEDWIWQEENNRVVINRKVKIIIFDEIGSIIK